MKVVEKKDIFHTLACVLRHKHLKYNLGTEK